MIDVPDLGGVQTGMEIQHSAKRAQHAAGIPNLIQLQLDSFRWFLEEGLHELFLSFSPIHDHTGTITIELIDFTLGEPKYTLEQCRSRDVTFESPIKVRVRLTTAHGEVKESEVYLGDLPLMTEKGTFIINGAERVVVSQLSRSPGIYFRDELDLTLNWQFSATLIPSEGPWVEIETDTSEAVMVRIGQNKKFAITTLLRALNDPSLQNDLVRDRLLNQDELSGVFNVDYREAVGKTLAEHVVDNVTGEVIFEAGYTVTYADRAKFVELAGGEENLRNHRLNVIFKDPQYETDTQILERFGTRTDFQAPRGGTDEERELFVTSIVDTYALQDFVSSAGKVVASPYQRVDKTVAKTILETLEAENSDGIVTLLTVPKYLNATLDIEEANVVDSKSAMFDIHRKLRPGDPPSDESVRTMLRGMFFDVRRYDMAKVGRHKLNKKLSTLQIPHKVRWITRTDICAIIDYLIGMQAAARADGQDESRSRYTPDDIDHLENKRVRSVGELLYSQLRMGFLRMEKVAKERMTSMDSDDMLPPLVLSVKPVSAAIKSFFGSSQLSQFMDQTNPLAEITSKRRLSSLGPGGLSRQSAKLEVRDVHHSHYGRICPIETPEGPNIGLIGSMAVQARVDQFGFLETPYRKVINGQVTRDLEWLPADNEHHYKIGRAPLEEDINEDGTFKSKTVQVRFNSDYPVVSTGEVQFVDVSPQQLVSVATAMIPFLENDDANRALMGANMQRQAVPTVRPAAPLVKTGMERKAAVDSGAVILAKRNGTVHRVTSKEVVLKTPRGEFDRYVLLNMVRSNQGTCISQRPKVDLGQVLRTGDLIADGPCCDNGELSLGQNVLVAFMPWNGYNYEDAILLSQRLVKDDVFTSIHIEKYELEARDTKLGPEEMTRDIPNVGEDALKDLDEDGIIRIGAEVRSDDILIGKVAPKGQGELTAEERLIIAIFGKKAEDTRDVSLRVPHGEKGKIVDIKVFSRHKYRCRVCDAEFNFSKKPDNEDCPKCEARAGLQKLAGDDGLQPGVNKLVRIYIAQKRKIMEGDKMAGRHGNKGVVSKILPEADMPFLADGTPVDIVLNPLGVPSRMNIGQIMETHLGLVAKEFGIQFKEPIFEGSTEAEILSEMGRYGRRRRREMLNTYLRSDLEVDVELSDDDADVEDLLSTVRAAFVELDADELERISEILAGPPVGDTIPRNYAYDRLLESLRERVWARVGFYDKTCKSQLRDGRTGDDFKMPITVGRIYMLKLAHLVDDKIHARSTGPYSLVTQQPLGGKAQFGGQRFGEMEVWALEAYGAAYTLQEILTIKSDDVIGRVKTYESIVKGDAMLEPGVPESFKILVNELQSLGLKVTVEDAKGDEIDLRDKDEDYLEDEAQRRRSQLRQREEYDALP
jgi:DNA-directed RNA polymerase subunit beta